MSDTGDQDDAMARNFARSYGGEFARTGFLARGLSEAARTTAQFGVTVAQVQQRLRELSDFIGRQNGREKAMLDEEIAELKREMQTGFTLTQLAKFALLLNRGGDPNLALALYDTCGDVMDYALRQQLNVAVDQNGRLSDKWLAIARRHDYTVDGVIDAIDNLAREIPGVAERVSIGLPNEITEADLRRDDPSADARAAEIEEVRALRARLNSEDEGGVIRQALDAGHLDSVRIIADRSRSRLQFHLRKGHKMSSPSYPINLSHTELASSLRAAIADL